MTNLQSKLKFLTEISLFYPVILQALSKDDPEIIFRWGVVIFSLILSFLFIDYFDKNSEVWAKKFVNFFIIGGIVSYGVQLYIFSLLFSKGTISDYLVFFLAISTTTIIVFPVVIMLFMTGYLAVKYFLGAFKKV